MADGDSNASETLFSFEVLVEYIQFHKPGIAEKGFEPAVGLRLLDFPTLVIYRGGQEDNHHLEDLDSEKENAATHVSKPDVSLQNPINRHMEYPFKKGKSCLFKINLDLLHTHLSNVPLYVMVLDSGNEIPKLMGSSMVSLAKTIDIIKTDVKHLGICTPSAHGEKGLFGLYNLMGEKIGCISLGYKLLSLGASLIPHIPKSRVLHLGSSKTPVKQPLKPSDIFLDDKTRSDEVILQPDSSNVLYENVELNGQRTDVVVSETKAKHGVSTGTQTEPARRQVKRIEVEQRVFDTEWNQNVYCPPPLFYSRSGGDPEEKEDEGGGVTYRHVSVAMEALTVEDLDDEEEEEVQDLPVERRSVAVPEEVQGRPRASEQSWAPPPLLGEALRRLPLLSALLQELSQLNRPAEELPAPASTGHDWGRQPAPADPPKQRPLPRSCCASPVSRGSRSPGPRSKRSQQGGHQAGKAQRQGLRPGEKEPTTPPPRRRLVHGLTRTVRLRLQQHNPGLLREQDRRSRSAVPKPTTRGLQRTRAGSTKPGHARGRDGSSNLDGNVQTLVSSVDVDSARTETPRSGESGRFGSRQSGCRDISGATPLAPHCDRVSVTTAGGSPAPGESRTVQVRIPSALGQLSDLSEGGGAARASDGSEPWPPPRVGPGFRSASGESSPFSSPTLLRPEIHHGSPDRSEYPDDFTSLEPTECLSPDPPESPAGRPAPSSDSDSQDRRGARSSSSASAASQQPRGPALSFPVKSDKSPQRSLKATHVIRPRTRASAISLSSGDSELAAPPALALPRGPSGGPGARPSERSETSPSPWASPADSRALSDDSEPGSVLSPTLHMESVDELGSLGFSNKCHHISELVLNKLPGYTL